jgi:hypothetical protein
MEYGDARTYIKYFHAYARKIYTKIIHTGPPSSILLLMVRFEISKGQLRRAKALLERCVTNSNVYIVLVNKVSCILCKALVKQQCFYMLCTRMYFI